MKPAVCKPNPPINADRTGTAMSAPSGVIFRARMAVSKATIVAKPRMASMGLCAAPARLRLINDRSFRKRVEGRAIQSQQFLQNLVRVLTSERRRFSRRPRSFGQFHRRSQIGRAHV